MHISATQKKQNTLSQLLGVVWYGIVEFNVPLNTV